MNNKIYMCIDLKSFYASVECVERSLDPLTTNLVVADSSKTNKTICLAVTPSLKKYGLGGRARLFEVVNKVKIENQKRLKNNNYKKFSGKSFDDKELSVNKNLEIDYIVATPRMSYYMKYSARIYNIYLKYISASDIYVYSIDEVFCDITNYLKYYNLTKEQLTSKIIKDVIDETGITATAGLGTNMYLAKVAMDIIAKKTNPDKNGVRMYYLDEAKYRRELWNYKPLTSFWRIGSKTADKLNKYGVYTMGDLARLSIKNEDILYKLFGVNAELLIDHAWGYESVNISDIKNYNPKNSSLSSGQVLNRAYNYEEAKLIIKEMIDSLALELVNKKLITNQIILNISYDSSYLDNNDYESDIVVDYYGKPKPINAHGSLNILYTSSFKILMENILKLYDMITSKKIPIKKINITVCNLKNEESINSVNYYQLNLFSSDSIIDEKKKEKEDSFSEKKLQNVIIDIKNKYGKNAILKGMDLKNYATAIERNNQIGGHKS